MFPIEYGKYIEPFGGSGAVLLGKPKPDKFEVYNDYNHNLVNLFRCMRDRPMGLIKELGFCNLNSRLDYKDLSDFLKKETFDDTYIEEEIELTKTMLPMPYAEEIIELFTKSRKDHDLRRAAMFLKSLRYSYASGGKSFAGRPFSIRSLFKLIEQVSGRLDKVVIENKDFEALIKQYDSDDAFIYCDPPYFTSEYVYQCGFSWDDHVRLRKTLADAKGKWLVSYNDCPQIRALYYGCNFFKFTRAHSMALRYSPGAKFHELLIGNYDLLERDAKLPKQLTLWDKPKDEFKLEKILKECIILWKTK